MSAPTAASNTVVAARVSCGSVIVLDSSEGRFDPVGPTSYRRIGIDRAELRTDGDVAGVVDADRRRGIVTRERDTGHGRVPVDGHGDLVFAVLGKLS